MRVVLLVLALVLVGASAAASSPAPGRRTPTASSATSRGGEVPPRHLSTTLLYYALRRLGLDTHFAPGPTNSWLLNAAEVGDRTLAQDAASRLEG